MTDAAAKPSTLSARWGADTVRYGYTVIPVILIEKQAALGLEPVDLAILIHLIKFWWTPHEVPYPSKARLSAAIGLSPRSIQRRIAALEKAGFIERRARKTEFGGNSSNEYHLTGLIEALRPHAVEALQLRAQQREEREKTQRRKRAIPRGSEGEP